MNETVGGIVLCGGESRRMGTSKAELPFGDQPMLLRMTRLLQAIDLVSPVVVVAAADQQLPQLDDQVIVTHDRQPGRGPLEGLAAGLRSLAGQQQLALVISCDIPLLQPALALRLIELVEDHDVVLPVQDGRDHPLLAVYRVNLCSRVEELLEAEQRRMSSLFTDLKVRRVDTAELVEQDPQLLSFLNVNHPEDYLQALELAGFQLDIEIEARLAAEQGGAS